jgi:integrase
MAPKRRNHENRALPKYWRFYKGSYSYRVPPQLRHLHGGKTEISLGQSLSGAYQKFALLYQTEECITLMRSLFDRYAAEVVPDKAQSTQKSNYRSLTRLRDAIGDNLVNAVTSQAIYTYRDKCGRKYSKKYANLDLEVLSHCFTKAIEWGVIHHHPMTNKKVVKFSLKGRDRYVEDWELEEWCRVASPFLLAYAGLKGVTGLRKQDMLTIRLKDISETELTSVNLKTGKTIRFPLYDTNGEPTTVKLALDDVQDYYRSQRKHKRAVVMSQYLFHNRKGECYWSFEKATCSGFDSIWQRHMKKALSETQLEEKFTDHDLRTKVASDLDTDQQASDLMAHSSLQVTRKHYRLKGQKAVPASGFNLHKKKSK